MSLKNVGKFERIVRVVLGIVMIPGSLFLSGISAWILALVGIFLIITGIFSS